MWIFEHLGNSDRSGSLMGLILDLGLYESEANAVTVKGTSRIRG